MRPTANIGGVELPFCVMNASGTVSTVDDLIALARSDSGAVVMRSVTIHPFLHPEFRTLHNPGYDRYLPLLKELRAFSKPIISSIAGASTDEFVTLATALSEAGADIIEVNLADAYVAATLAPWEDSAGLARMLAAVREAAGRPILVRCPERVPLSVAEVRDVLASAAVDGVILSNTFETLEKFVLQKGSTMLAVVAMGGVRSGYDLLSTLRKGATAVQVGAVLASEGPGVFRRLASEYEAIRDRG